MVIGGGGYIIASVWGVGGYGYFIYMGDVEQFEMGWLL